MWGGTGFCDCRLQGLGFRILGLRAFGLRGAEGVGCRTARCSTKWRVRTRSRCAGRAALWALRGGAVAGWRGGGVAGTIDMRYVKCDMWRVECGT